MATIATTGFDYLLNPTTVIETSGTVTRTTTVTYLLDGRLKTTVTAVTGLSGSTPTLKKDTTYDTATGLQTVAIALATDGTVASSVATAYDGWARPISYQPSGQAATTTSYNATGDVGSITDPNGVTSYTYGGTDAAGSAESRPVVTQVDVTTAGSTWTSTAAYDGSGAMTLQKLPGGVSQKTRYDNTGDLVSLTYSGAVTTTDENGNPVTDPDGPWLSWSQDSDVNGRVTHEWTPDGKAFATDANPYDRAYSYDAAGRLTEVRDRTGAPGNDTSDPLQASCITRKYAFDDNDNRTSKTAAVSGSDGLCTSAGATSSTRLFDTADRPTSGSNGQGSYTYDQLGRSPTIPAADAPTPQAGDISIAYYDNDLTKTITQGTSTTTFTLDALDRRAVETTTVDGVPSQTTRYYTDGSDNPTWVTHGSTTQRYTELVGGDLAFTTDQTGAGQLAINNPHGDTVTTIPLASATTTAAGITGWNNYEEYGATTTTTSNTGVLRYGCLALTSEQRQLVTWSSWAHGSTTPRPGCLPPATLFLEATPATTPIPRTR